MNSAGPALLMPADKVLCKRKGRGLADIDDLKARRRISGYHGSTAVVYIEIRNGKLFRAGYTCPFPFLHIISEQRENPVRKDMDPGEGISLRVVEYFE